MRQIIGLVAIFVLLGCSSTSGLKEQIEEQIASQTGLKHVVITPTRGQKLLAKQGMELEAVELINDHSFQATLADRNEKKYVVFGSY